MLWSLPPPNGLMYCVFVVGCRHFVGSSRTSSQACRYVISHPGGYHVESHGGLLTAFTSSGVTSSLNFNMRTW